MAVVLLLLIHCLLLLPPVVGRGPMFCPCFVIHYFVSVEFCDHLDGEERAGCFAFTVCLVSFDSQCSVGLPHGTVGWSAVCDCGYS